MRELYEMRRYVSSIISLVEMRGYTVGQGIARHIENGERLLWISSSRPICICTLWLCLGPSYPWRNTVQSNMMFLSKVRASSMRITVPNKVSTHSPTLRGEGSCAVVLLLSIVFIERFFDIADHLFKVVKLVVVGEIGHPGLLRLLSFVQWINATFFKERIID